jgi:hypothetical protein
MTGAVDARLTASGSREAKSVLGYKVLRTRSNADYALMPD